jgi:hypothetical protein
MRQGSTSALDVGLQRANLVWASCGRRKQGPKGSLLSISHGALQLFVHVAGSFSRMFCVKHAWKIIQDYPVTVKDDGHLLPWDVNPKPGPVMGLYM